MDRRSLLEAARVARGLTQDAVARRSGTSQLTLSAYERGAKSPTLAVAVRILHTDAYAWLLQLGDEEQLFTHLEGALLVDAWPDVAPRLSAVLRRQWEPLLYAAGGAVSINC